MFDFKVKGLDELEEYWKKVDNQVINLEPFFQESGEKIIKDSFVSVFRSGSVSISGKTGGTQAWAPLAPATLAARRRRGNRRTKILWDTGQLRDSLVHDPFIKIENNEMFVGSSDPRNILIYHELGTRKMPARPVLGYAAIVAAPKLERGLKKHITGVLSNA